MTTEMTESKAGLPATKEDVRTGGVSAEDMTLPRALILQALSPAVRDGDGKEGTIINSITKEVLGDKFVPILIFKQYAKFTDNGLEFSTPDRTDPRVQEGLKWVDGEKPAVTEYLNVLCLFESDPTLPVILSFKRGSLKTGREFNTLISIKTQGGKVKPYSSVYSIELKNVKNGQNDYWTPKVKPVAGKAGKASAELQEAAESFEAAFAPTIKHTAVEDAEGGTPF